MSHHCCQCEPCGPLQSRKRRYCTVPAKQQRAMCPHDQCAPHCGNGNIRNSHSSLHACIRGDRTDEEENIPLFFLEVLYTSTTVQRIDIELTTRTTKKESQYGGGYVYVSEFWDRRSSPPISKTHTTVSVLAMPIKHLESVSHSLFTQAVRA